MMSGLEINTTFVSYIKTSMYLTGMSPFAAILMNFRI